MKVRILNVILPLPESVKFYKNGWFGEAEKGSEDHPH
jgi:hypothetical protein